MKKSRSRTSQNRSQAGLNSVAFATVARELSIVARQWGSDAPSFRSPPRIAGLRRSISRRADGSSTVAVTTRNRSVVAVISDMVEGVLVSASVPAATSGAFRDALWASIEPQLVELLGVSGPTPAKTLAEAS